MSVFNLEERNRINKSKRDIIQKEINKIEMKRCFIIWFKRNRVGIFCVKKKSIFTVEDNFCEDRI